MLIYFFRLAIIPCVSVNEVKCQAHQEVWCPSSSPEEHGLNSTKLNEMLDFIGLQSVQVDSVIIIRNDHIIFEEYPCSFYDSEKRHHLFSVTKSFTSALLGIAIDMGLIVSVDAKITNLFPDRTFANLDTSKQEITLEHFLTMSTGLEWDDYTDFYAMEASQDDVQYVLDKPMVAEPGTQFNYNSGASHVLSALIEEITGNSTLNFAREHLFEPLEITDVFWNQDEQGIYKGGTQLDLKPQDMAKFGYLYLNNGTWKDKQIVPAEWVNTSTKTHIMGRTNHFPGREYGYHWWIKSTYGYYYADGTQGQSIFIIPRYNMVVTFTATINSGDVWPVTLLRDYILPAIEGYIPPSQTVPYIEFSLVMAVLIALPMIKRRILSSIGHS
jgi:CubicO group peptidase (beta-lactamase class C family)